MTTEEMYEKFGIKKDVIDFGKTVLGEIEDRFAKIDEVAEINQLKVILAMQKNRVSENLCGEQQGMVITIPEEIRWKPYMLTFLKQKMHLCAHRLPAERMR